VNEIRRVLVVGGGVGGLTAAATLARRGVEVVLIERRPAFAVPGVGLGQPANALRVYDTLGVLEEILETGFIYDRMHIFDPGRQLIADWSCTKSCWQRPNVPACRSGSGSRSARSAKNKIV
jgi:2-polyprenyl-6-methoxyphenol hydroxylase-like FAD-dependent oxidoreductase